MKKRWVTVCSLLLCCTLLFAAFAPTAQAKGNSTLDLPEGVKTAVERFANLVIDAVNRGLLLVRYPWGSKANSTVDLSKFTLVLEDEFEGSRLNSRIWNHHDQGPRRGGYWDDSQVEVRDGNLVIKTSYNEDGEYGPGYYSACVASDYLFEQTYGYFECRCILPAAEGLWSAFWLMNKQVGKDGNPGTNGTEIDIFESPHWYRGKTGRDNSMVTSNLHWGGYSFQTKYRNVTIAKANNPYEEYNTYGLEWNKDGYIFYINGVETGRSSAGGVSQVPEYMMLSVEVDGVVSEPYHGWSGNIKNNKDGVLPAEFVVDYVRVYQYNDLVD